MYTTLRSLSLSHADIWAQPAKMVKTDQCSPHKYSLPNLKKLF